MGSPASERSEASPVQPGVRPRTVDRRDAGKGRADEPTRAMSFRQVGKGTGDVKDAATGAREAAGD